MSAYEIFLLPDVGEEESVTVKGIKPGSVSSALDLERLNLPGVSSDSNQGRSDRQDLIAALVLVFLLVSPLLWPISPVADTLTIAVAGAGLGWLIYARYR